MRSNTQNSEQTEQGVPPRVISVERRKAFFKGIVRSMRSELPENLRGFRNRGDFNLMKVWYDHYRLHYEIVLDQQINKIEVGLHFEDGPANSLAFLMLLDGRILEIKDVLGPQVELERWTQSWARIYELHPLVDLTDDVTSVISRRLAAYISHLQPLVAASGIPLERPGA